MAAPVPSLSTSGFVKNIAEKANKLTAYYFVNDRSQSTLFEGNITALAAQIQQYGNDELAIRRAVEDELTAYYGRYFDTVVVNVSTDTPMPNDPNRINLTVDVIMTEDGYKYSLGREIQTHKGAILDIIEINNYGS